MTTLTLQTDRSLVRAGARSTRYLHVSFTAPLAAGRPGRAPLTVAFALDRSGSMAGQKIALARQAVGEAIRLLRPQDRFALVVYDDRVDVLVPAGPATAEARGLAAASLDGVDARGQTALCEGWTRACTQVTGGTAASAAAGVSAGAAAGAAAGGTARCFLLSDGQANQGETDRAELARRADAMRQAHVATTTFGVGEDFDEELLAGMARAGGGQFYFIEHARQIPDLLTSALGEALEVVARQAVVELRLPDGVEAEVLNDFRSEQGDGRLRIALEDLVSGQEVSLLVALRFPTGRIGEAAAVLASEQATVTSQDEALAADAEIAWTYADHAANSVQPRNRAVDRLVTRIYAARARHLALQRNRQGDWAGAAAVLAATRARILRYAGTDAELLAIAATLQDEQPVFGAQMDRVSMKRAHFASSSVLRSRGVDGLALRRGK